MKLKSTMILAGLAVCLSLVANAQLSGPTGIAFDTKGNLWVANFNSSQVLELDPSNGTVLNTITSGLNGPSRLFFASSTTLYVTNTNGNNITVYDTKTLKLTKTISNSNINKPLGFVMDAYGDLYIANNAESANNVIALNVSGGLVETLTKDDSGFTFLAPGILVIHGQNIYAGFGPNSGTNAVISYNVGEFLTDDPKQITVYNDNVNTGPTGIAFDSKGNVYISEYTSATWVKYAPGGGSPLLVVNKGTAGCEGIALDKNENVYVSNSDNNNITVYNPSGTLINTIN